VLATGNMTAMMTMMEKANPAFFRMTERVDQGLGWCRKKECDNAKEKCLTSWHAVLAGVASTVLPAGVLLHLESVQESSRSSYSCYCFGILVIVASKKNASARRNFETPIQNATGVPRVVWCEEDMPTACTIGSTQAFRRQREAVVDFTQEAYIQPRNQQPILLSFSLCQSDVCYFAPTS